MNIKLIWHRRLAEILLVCLLLSFLTVNNSPLGAAYAASKNGVETKIDTLLTEFPSSSYFSVNRKACTHTVDSPNRCPNCQLSRIIPTTQNPSIKCIDAWTCCGFARYAYYVLFGIDTYYIRSYATEVKLANAKVGDFVVLRNGGHYAIYLGVSADGKNVYLYESNVGGPNKVSYNRATKASDVTSVWHANNYDTIAYPVQVKSITLSSGNMCVYAGASMQLAATVSPANATVRDVAWESSNTKIATVSSSGLVKFLNPGVVIITAKALDNSGKYAKAAFQVDRRVEKVSIKCPKTTMKRGERMQLSAVISPSDATNKAVSWTVNNSLLASIDKNGVLKAKSLFKGTVVVTVTTADGKKKATCNIKIK